MADQDSKTTLPTIPEALATKLANPENWVYNNNENGFATKTQIVIGDNDMQHAITLLKAAHLQAESESVVVPVTKNGEVTYPPVGKPYLYVDNPGRGTIDNGKLLEKITAVFKEEVRIDEDMTAAKGKISPAITTCPNPGDLVTPTHTTIDPSKPLAGKSNNCPT